MLNNLTNFFNLITHKMIKKVPEATDLIALGTRDTRYGGKYKATGVLYEDLKADILSDIPPVQQCCPVIDGNGNTVIDDTSENIVEIPDGVAPIDFIQEITDFSGMVMINDHYDGGVEMWLCGGGDCVLLNATTASQGGGLMGMSGSGYNWANAQGLLGPFTFTVIKSRASS